MNWTAAQVRESGRPMPGDSPKPNKYSARKKELDGIVFDSTREAKRYLELKVMQTFGLISELKCQPRFLLQEAFTDGDGKKHRKMEYVGDFQYRPMDGSRRIVEDCKGYATKVFKIKWKLVCYRYPHIRFVIGK